MPVTINLTSKFPITSAPTPIPDPELYVKKKLPEGRTVWISAPLPDKLVFVIPISSWVYADHISPKVSVSEFRKLFGEFLKDLPFKIAEHVQPPAFNADGNWINALLAFGMRDARVRFKFDKSYGGSIRVHLNPRKLGKGGFADLRKFFAKFFDLAKLPEASRVRELDVAVDVIGLTVEEVVAWHKKQHMRTMYVSATGVLETVNVHKKPRKTKMPDNSDGLEKPKLPKKRAGTVLVSIYDRVRYAERLGKEPPFGGAPVTRIELTKDYFKNTRLDQLPQLKDALAELRVGFIGSQLKWDKQKWRSYVTARRTKPADGSTDLLKLDHDAADEFEKALLVPKPDLVEPGATWLGWKKGIAQVGLLQLLATEPPAT